MTPCGHSRGVKIVGHSSVNISIRYKLNISLRLFMLESNVQQFSVHMWTRVEYQLNGLFYVFIPKKTLFITCMCNVTRLSPVRNPSSTW